MTATGQGHDGHERIEELLALDALDGLDEAERQELGRLRAETPCAECDRVAAEYRETAAELAHLAPDAEVPAGAEERLLAAAQAEPTERARPSAEPTGSADAAPAAGASVPGRRHTAEHAGARRQVIRRSGARRALFALAAAIILVVGGIAGYALGHTTEPAQTVAAVPHGLATFLADPDTRVAAFPHQGAGSGHLSVAYRPGSSQAWIIGTDLPAPRDDRVYQLWYAKGKGAQMRPSDTFRPGPDGSAAARMTIGPDVAVLAVTAEPHGGSRQPTSKPIALVKL